MPVPNQWLLRKGHLPADYVHIFMSTGGNGPDQVGTRNSLRSLLATSEYTWALFFSVHCLKHAYHLAVQSSLRLCDTLLAKLNRSYKYYTSVATLSHTWRGHLTKIRSVWWSQHGHEPGVGRLRATFRAPPLAIAGRWASIDGTLSCSYVKAFLQKQM